MSPKVHKIGKERGKAQNVAPEVTGALRGKDRSSDVKTEADESGKVA